MSSERAIKREYNVEIFKPESTPTSVTVFLPGTMLKLEDYKSTYDVLVEQNQVVIGFKSMNPFPIIGRSHDQMAEDCASVVKAFLELEENKNLPSKYNVVGHSLGGKVCLMVAAKFDIDNVKKVIALDPVDDKPQELTASRQSKRTDLNNSKAEEIHQFQSETDSDGWFPLCPPGKNATAIKEMYPDKIDSLYINPGAGHMSYKDTETDDASVKAREVVHSKIRDVIS